MSYKSDTTPRSRPYSHRSTNAMGIEDTKTFSPSIRSGLEDLFGLRNGLVLHPSKAFLVVDMGVVVTRRHVP